MLQLVIFFYIYIYIQILHFTASVQIHFNRYCFFFVSDLHYDLEIETWNLVPPLAGGTWNFPFNPNP